MNRSKLKLISVFIAGVVAGVIGLGILYSQRSMIGKVRKKLEQYRVARIPKKKKMFMISDFETKKDIQKLKLMSAEAESQTEHVTSGKKSAKITVNPSNGASGVVLEKIFKGNKRASNWEGYDSFAFDIFNPQDHGLRVILKIKDRKGRKYQRDLHLRPNAVNKVFVSIPQARTRIKPSQIASVNIFFWKPKKSKVLFIDNFRLMPARFLGAKNIVILDKQYIPKPGETVYKGGDYFQFDKERWISGVPLYINNPTDGAGRLPVSGGVPFAKGELKAVSDIRLYDRNRKPIIFQARPLGYWADGTVKWAQIDTVLDVIASDRQICYLTYGRENKRPKFKFKSQLKVQDKKKEVIVDTGVLKILIKKDGFRLFDNVWLDKNNDGRYAKNELILNPGDLVIVHNGREYRTSLDKKYNITVEEEGPLKVTLKAEGWFVSKKKKKFCKFIVRIKAFAGQEFVKVTHTFIYTGYPENKEHYLYKGKRLPKNETIDAIYIETPYNLPGNLKYDIGIDGKSLSDKFKKNLDVRQEHPDKFSVNINGKDVFNGKRSEGWIDLSNADKGISIIEKNLWEQFPKGWHVDVKRGVIRTDLWPQWSGELDLRTTSAANGDEAVARGSAFGLGKTHELAFYFHSGPFSREVGWNIVKLLERSIVLTAVPAWVYDTNVIGKVVPRLSKSHSPAEQAIDLMFDWVKRHVEINKWYGMIDFGDVVSLNRDGTWLHDGREGWLNNEAVGLATTCFIQYLRTGEHKYFEFAENNSRHVMDVDTVHYNTIANDKRLKKRIFDDYSQVGSQHRHNADHWGGRNEETSHTNLHGILLYYYMTGNERAFDVAKEIGEFFLKERMTYYKHPDICPQRNAANVLWGAVEMFEATGDERYKKLADKWADVFYRGQRHDGTWGETYNPEAGNWEGKDHTLFTLNYTLPALVAYHRMTGNKAVAESIVAATTHYADHRPYNPFLEAAVYSYYITGENMFLKSARERFDYYVKHQNRSNDPLKRGMIYQKAYYLRPIEFLFQLPFGFEAFKIRDRVIREEKEEIEERREKMEGRGEKIEGRIVILRSDSDEGSPNDNNNYDQEYHNINVPRDHCRE